jgi:hypothetical protein
MQLDKTIHLRPDLPPTPSLPFNFLMKKLSNYSRAFFILDAASREGAMGGRTRDIK